MALGRTQQTVVGRSGGFHVPFTASQMSDPGRGLGDGFYLAHR
jgi:hypothetical protein